MANCDLVASESRCLRCLHIAYLSIYKAVSAPLTSYHATPSRLLNRDLRLECRFGKSNGFAKSIPVLFVDVSSLRWAGSDPKVVPTPTAHHFRSILDRIVE